MYYTCEIEKLLISPGVKRNGLSLWLAFRAFSFIRRRLVNFRWPVLKSGESCRWNLNSAGSCFAYNSCVHVLSERVRDMATGPCTPDMKIYTGNTTERGRVLYTYITLSGSSRRRRESAPECKAQGAFKGVQGLINQWCSTVFRISVEQWEPPSYVPSDISWPKLHSPCHMDPDWGVHYWMISHHIIALAVSSTRTQFNSNSTKLYN